MPDEPDLSCTTHDEPAADEALLVDAALEHANQAAAPLHQVRPLATFARLGPGEPIGGAIGRTWGACCELQQLWVHPDHRRRGIASRLVRAFEARARQRGCRTFYLETFSFQAPALYRSLGYEVASELHGFAPGVIKYLMVRREQPGAATG